MTATPTLPRMYLVEQRFSRESIADIPAAVRGELARLEPGKTIRPGHTVAIAAGSRGIRRIDEIIKSVVGEMKALGAKPFIVPAMGSHGGGTAEGQRDVLGRYGVTEEAMGCEVRSSMDVVRAGESRLGMPVYLDRFASGADHIAVVNRVKPHTKLIGRVESGLVKMCLVGLGKREGARAFHRAVGLHPWMDVAESSLEVLLGRSRLAFGLAVIQSAYEEIAGLAALYPQDFLREEPALLEKARSLMGRLPFNDVDLLIVDRMGKEISGTGMDTNITGRKDGSPMRVTHVFVRDLTDATRGNAQGIGLADFTTRRLVEKIDYRALYVNAQTAYRTDSCKVPMTFDCDRDALRTAFEMSGAERPEEYRIAWIRNTLDLERIALSEAYLGRLEGIDSARTAGAPFPVTFDGDGNLVSPFEEAHRE